MDVLEPSAIAFQNLQVLNFEELCLLETCTLAKKFAGKFGWKVSGRNTRQSDEKNLIVPSWNREHSRMQFGYFGAAKFNSLPNEIKGIQKLSTFRSKLKREILEAR